MGYNFIECNREQQYLLPPSLAEWLPEKDLAWFVVDAVDQMDISGIYRRYRGDGCGASAFEPRMMTALMLYSYCMGVRSSRQIERLCERDVGYRVIAANRHPDHSTISRFRKDNRERLGGLFTDILRMCGEAGLVKVGVVAVDGTKVEANASLAANRTYSGLKAEVEKMLDEAEAVDAEEDAKYGKDRRGDELPEDLQDRGNRLKRLREAKARLEQEAAEEAGKQAEKVARREEEERQTGKKKRGRKPKEPDSSPKEEAKANVTDPESRIMKGQHGYVQGYNCQASVTEEQIIVAGDVTQEENDTHQMHPMLEKTDKELKEAGIDETVDVALFDAGYCNEENLKEADPFGPEVLAATTKDWKQRKAMREQGYPRGRIPKGLTEKEKMERKLLTKRGRELYRKRKIMPEPVFGYMKEVLGFDRFLVRGLEAVRSEWRLMCSAHNLLKLWRKRCSLLFQTPCLKPVLARS